jgi:hypothetical protein
MTIFLLILHGLLGVVLLGALTHQSVSLLRGRAARGFAFLDRYAGARDRTFTTAVVALFVAELALGAIIYPAYRLSVRIPFEEMSLGWAIGVFELKEHFAGLGLAVLPYYAYTWKSELAGTLRVDRLVITLILAFIVWWDFLVGHVLNNIRGLE